jgi:hypothetical protein
MPVLLNRNAVLAAAVAATIGLAAPAGAQEGDRVQRVSVAEFHYINDVPIHVTGEMVSFERVTEDANGGFHLVIHLNATGLTGVTEDGTTYRGTRAESLKAYASPDETQALTHTLTFLLVGPGQDNHIRVHMDAHITVNADGEVVVSFERVTLG